MKFLPANIAAFLLLTCALACQQHALPVSAKNANPAAVGFDASGSDPKAIAIADAAMEAMGGRAAWDAAHYISWNFFGNRTLLWDKYTGYVRIAWLKKPLTVVVNINDGAGKVWRDGVAQTQPDTLKKYLKMGREAWINDAYWLVMPYKLKDSGVTLKYLSATTTEDGQAADLLQLTFKNVGVTPDNKYHVWVNKQSHLVTQWAYFKKFDDVKPAFINPWTNYKTYGKIMLSGTRDKDRNLTPIEVLDSVPENAFEK